MARNALAGLVVARALAGPEPPERHPRRRRRPWRQRMWASLSRRARVVPCRDERCVFLAEHYLPDVSPAGVDALTRRLEQAAATIRLEGPDVRFLGFAFLPEDEAFLSVLAAPSAEAAERAVARAELAADRIVPALWRAGLAD